MPEDIAARFERDTAGHGMTVLHDDGLYRHLRFQNPGRSAYWFDLVTWPGFLAFAGDMDGYVFTRVEDMFTFFRGHNINPDYWAEKVVDGRDRLKRYEQDLLDQQVKEALAEYDTAYPDLVVAFEGAKVVYDGLPQSKRYPFSVKGMREPFEPRPPAEVRELVADFERDGETSHEAGARRMLGELESARVVLDTWEWDLRDWDWQFLWACHAIVRGIAEYDAHRARVAGAVTADV
jgi:hypothetical protein